MLFNESIIPYSGTESIKLYQSTDEVKKMLASESIDYREELWSGNFETNPNPWTVITVNHVMSLFFAKNRKLFRIVLWQAYSGSLPNGIHTGMKMNEATAIDPDLRYDNWNEDYESDAGYWLEDDVESGRIISISIFIKELLDEDQFDNCDW